MTPLHAIGWPGPDAAPDPHWTAAIAVHPLARPARVTEQHRSGYIVAEGPDANYTVESPPQWQRPPGYGKGKVPSQERAAVGDWVLVEGEGASATIVALLPRHSAIKRGAAGEHYQQQVIAANIDNVFVVCGLDADFNPRRIERYLLLVQGDGAGSTESESAAPKSSSPSPVVVLTKVDTTEDLPDALTALAQLQAQAIPIVAVNAKDPASVAALSPWLGPGRSIALVGSSGAGKSTLTNTLLGIEKMKTGEVRASDSRGRHTTSHRALLPLPSGACLIDTPGMRELKPTGEEDVAMNFSDVDALGAQCRFRDCAHAGEPGCAVRAAIQGGSLDPARYANYVKLRDEVASAAGQLAARASQKQGEKVQGRAFNKRLEDKYGKH